MNIRVFDEKIIHNSVIFRNLALVPSATARNLGVIFDSGLDFKKHISSVCRSSFYQIRQIRQIRSSLNMDSAITLANSLVHSKIDYCNSLLLISLKYPLFLCDEFKILLLASFAAPLN